MNNNLDFHLAPIFFVITQFNYTIQNRKILIVNNIIEFYIIKNKNNTNCIKKNIRFFGFILSLIAFI